MKTRAAVLALAALALLPGCLEEKTVVTIFPDGSGKMTFSRKLGKDLSGFVLRDADPAKQKAALDKEVVNLAARWDGVVAWGGVNARVEEGCVLIDAVAYVEDFAKVSKRGSGADATSEESFAWKVEGGAATLDWKAGNKPRKGEPLDEKSPRPGELEKMMGLYKTIRFEHTVVFPGEITEATNAKAEGGRATLLRTGAELVPPMEAAFKALAEVKKKVEAKELTREKANAELEPLFKKLDEIGNGTIRVAGKVGDVAAAKAEFAKELEAAKTAWKDSELAKKIAEKAAAPEIKPPTKGPEPKGPGPEPKK